MRNRRKVGTLGRLRTWHVGGRFASSVSAGTMNSVDPYGRAQLSRRVDGRPPALERGSRIARGWLFAVAALIGLLGVFAPSAAEASVRGRRAVPDLRNPRTTPRTSRQTMIRIPVTLHLATDSGEAIASKRSVERWVI